MRRMMVSLFALLLVAASAYVTSVVAIARQEKPKAAQNPKPTGEALPLAIDPDVRAKKADSAKTSEDGPRDLAETVSQCTENRCKTSGCATCDTFRVNLPLTAQVIAVKCFTTANYPNDRALSEIPCGQDWAWSYFEWPTQSTTSTNKVVSARYFNRSHNRKRTAKLQVTFVE